MYSHSQHAGVPPRLRLSILGAVVAIAASPGVAAGITVSVVDAERGVPLEFWVKESKLANGRTLAYCEPFLFIDGVQRPYPDLGGGMALHEGDDDIASSIADVIGDEGAADESAILSDNRPPEQRNQGWVSKIKVDGLAAGGHVLLPGGASFTVGGNGLLAGADAPLEVASPQTLRVPCLPLDLDLPAAPAREAYATIASGGKSIHRHMLRSDGGVSVRLYLPASTEPYELLVDGLPGKAVFDFSAEQGVTVRSETFGEANGLVLHADGNALAFLPAPAQGAGDEPGDSVAEDSAGATLSRRAAKAPSAGVVTDRSGDALYLFTDRSRHAYMEGEPIALSLRAAGAPAQAAKADFALAPVGTGNGAPLPVGSAVLRKAGAGAFADVELDTALLRPGDYTLTATCGGTTSNPFPLTIGPAFRATNMKLHTWEKWGGADMAPDFLRTAVQAGLNLVCQGAAPEHGATGLTPNGSNFGEHYRTPMTVADIADGTPLELAEPPTENQAGIEYLLAHGVESMPILYGASILYFNVGTNFLDHAEDRFQSTAHFGMEWRRFPNFGGMSYCSGDGMTPATQGTVWGTTGVGSFDNVHSERLDRLRDAFEAAIGPIEMDDSLSREDWQRVQDRMDGAWGFGFGLETRVTVRGEDDRKIKWFEWLNDIYPAAFRDQRKALSGPLPDPIVNVTGTWGYGAGGGMHPGTLYRFGDFSVNDAHGDWGVTPFMYVSNSDVYNGMGMEERGPRTWEVLDMVGIREELCGYKLLLQALSRNPAGIGLQNLGHDEIAAGWGKLKRKSETLAHLFDIASRYGDVYRQLERVDEVAVVGSLRQAALGGQTLSRLVGAHYALQKAGWQANCIEEAYCVNHPEMLSRRFKALCLVDMTAAPSEAFRKALARFREEGGILLGDAASKNLVPGIIEIPVIPLAGANMNDHWETQTNFMPVARQVADILAPALPSFFETDVYNVTAIRSADADLEYWTVWNDTKDETVGPVDGCGFQFTYQGTNATLAARAKGTLYDALRGAPADAYETPDGLAIDLDFRTFPGTILVLADRPIDSLRLSHSPAVAPGALLRLSAAALDADGRPFEGKLPAEFTVSAPDGTVRYRIRRPTNTPIELKIAGNDPAGTWSVQAVDQVAGLSVESTFEVAGARRLPQVAALDHIVSDAESIHALLGNHPVDVLLFADQASLRKQGEALAARLREAGVDATFRILLPSQFREHPMQWRYRTIEDSEFFDGLCSGLFAGRHVRGKNQLNDFRNDGGIKYAFYQNYTASACYSYHRNVILLGQAGETSNPFLDHILRYRMMLRNPSPNVPAHGQGLLGYAWSPFHYGNDAIVAYGSDAAGLAAACGELVRIASLDEPPAPAFRPITGRAIVENGQVFRSMGYPAADPADTAVAEGRESTRGSLLPPSFSLEMVQALPAADGRIAVRQEQRSEKDGPKYVAIDADAKSAEQFRADPAIDDGAATFVRWLALGDTTAPWPNAKAVRLSGGRALSPVDTGIGLSDAGGRPVWFYDPFEKAETIDEARYLRACMRIAVSPDESTLLAAFFDSYPGAGMSLHNKNRGDVLWLETATGKVLGRMEGYLGNVMSISADNLAATVLDDTSVRDGTHPCRFHWNPEEDFVIASFGRNGEKHCAMAIERPVESCLVSRDGRLAVLTYADPRRIVTVADMVEGELAHIPYPRADLGVAVDDSGEFALVSYSDSTLCKFLRDGSLAWRVDTPAPGVPAIGNDGAFWFATHDGRLYPLAADGTASGGEPVDFAEADVVDIAANGRFGIPPGLRRPAPAAGDALPRTLFSTAAAPADVPADSLLDGETSVTLAVPKLERNELAKVCVTYQLDTPGSELHIRWTRANGEELLYRFPYAAEAAEAAIPMREGGEVPLALSVHAGGKAELSRWRVVKAALDEELDNVAYAPPVRAGGAKASGNIQVPRVIVPNVFAYIGDLRQEQAAYGFALPRGAKLVLPPDLAASPGQTQPSSYFDGDVLRGDPLYPVVYPSYFDHPDGMRDLRSATILMEFEKPRSVRGIGIWEHPHDLPTEAFLLECCDAYAVNPETRVLQGDWKLVCAGRGNHDYFHAMDFPETEARVWRFTIVRTPGAIQRVAEVELYGSALDELMDFDVGGGDLLDDLGF
ncbi:MAG: hypothetical protein ACOX5G_01805 [Kiritimatiellia bacterium]|jgi:hypothetical protein